MKLLGIKLIIVLLALVVFKVPGAVSAVSIAVFPVADLSKGDNSVNYALTEHLESVLADNGTEVVSFDTVISFMARNRVRWVGYLDTSTIVKAREDMGIDLILLSTISQQNSQNIPSLGLSLQLIRAVDGKVVWAGSNGRSLADEQKFLGLNEPRTLDELQGLVAADLLAGLPVDLNEAATPPAGTEEEMARQPKIEIVNLGPKYIRPGEQIKCAVRVVTVSDLYEAPEVFIKVGSRVHLAREARDPLIYAEYEGNVFEATREYEDIIKEAEAEVGPLFREAGVFKAAPMREAEEELFPRFRDAESIDQAPLREAADDDGIFREAETLDTSPLREAEDDGRLFREAEILDASPRLEAQAELRKQGQDDVAEEFFAHLVNTDLNYKYNNNYVDYGIGMETGHEQGIFRLAEFSDGAPLMEAEDDGGLFRQAADEMSPVVEEASVDESAPVLQATQENSVYYEASWVGSDSMSGTSAANYNGIGTPTVDVAMASNDARFFEGIWSGTERDDRYPVSLVLRWPDGKQVVSFLGSYTVDSHPPRIGLDLKGDVYEGIVTFRDHLVIVPRLFNREPFNHWEIIIEDTMGNVVRRNRGWGNLPTQFVWQGRHTNGIKMPDGIYRIVMNVWDRAENMGSADQSVALMRTPPTVELMAVQQDKEFNLDISQQGTLPLAHWYLEIRSQSGKVLKSVGGETLPARVGLELTTALKKDKLFGIIELRDILGNKSRKEVDDLYLLALQKKEAEIQKKEEVDITIESWDSDF